MVYDQMPDQNMLLPWACAITGGLYIDSYNVLPGVDGIVPVDVYVLCTKTRNPYSRMYAAPRENKKVEDQINGSESIQHIKWFWQKKNVTDSTQTSLSKKTEITIQNLKVALSIS